MINHTVKYTDFEGNEATRVFQFHLSTRELAELDMYEKSERMEAMQRRFQWLEDPENGATDREKVEAVQAFMTLFEEILLAAYGVRDSEDYFEKTPELTRRFTRHAAYSDFLYSFSTDPNTAVAFLNGLVPAESRAAAQKQQMASADARTRSEAMMEGHKQPAQRPVQVRERPASEPYYPNPSAETVPGAMPLPAGWEPNQGLPEGLTQPRHTFEPSARPNLTPEQLQDMSPEAIAAYYRGDI